MPGTDPDPHRVLDDLRARLTDLRSLTAQFPNERAYPLAADHVAAAIQVLAPVVSALKA